MGDEENKVITAGKAFAAISGFFSILEKAAIALFMMFMERAKIKEKKANDEKANAQSDTKIAENELKVTKENSGKSDSEIIDDFLSK